jgi:hypothetical protein
MSASLQAKVSAFTHLDGEELRVTEKTRVSNITEQDAETCDVQKGPTVSQTRININNTKTKCPVTPVKGNLIKF